MPIDSRILLAGQPVEMPDHLANMIKAQQPYNDMMHNKLVARQMQAADANDARTNMLSGLVKASIDPATGQPDSKKLMSALAQNGMYSEMQDVQKSELERQQQDRLAKDREITRRVDIIDYGLKGLSMVRDQAGLDALKNEMESLRPGAGANFPKVYSPEAVADMERKAMSVKDQLSLGMQQKEFEYRQKHDADVLGQQERNSANEEAWKQQNFDQRERGIEATRINKPLSPMQQKSNDAQEMLGLIEQAKPLLDKSTSSGIGASVDTVQAYFGGSNPGANASSALQVIGANMVSKIPKPPGAQSDAELRQAQIAAGRLGDPTVPAEQKKAALNEIIAINERQIKRAQEAGMIGQPQQPQEQSQGSYSQADIEHTAKKYGLTPEQVIQKLNGQ